MLRASLTDTRPRVTPAKPDDQRADPTPQALSPSSEPSRTGLSNFCCFISCSRAGASFPPPHDPSKGRSMSQRNHSYIEHLEGRQMLAASWGAQAKLIGQDLATQQFPQINGRGM